MIGVLGHAFGQGTTWANEINFAKIMPLVQDRSHHWPVGQQSSALITTELWIPPQCSIKTNISPSCLHITIHILQTKVSKLLNCVRSTGVFEADTASCMSDRNRRGNGSSTGWCASIHAPWVRIPWINVSKLVNCVRFAGVSVADTASWTSDRDKRGSGSSTGWCALIRVPWVRVSCWSPGHTSHSGTCIGRCACCYGDTARRPNRSVFRTARTHGARPVVASKTKERLLMRTNEWMVF